jgi:asparagine synthase (glutamine-hydrolysing)
MCGICGIWGRHDREAVEAMVRAMAHRGPDDTGVQSSPRVGLGMTRLAVIDTSSGGHQPMTTEDGSITIVYNGETYNFSSERRELEAHGYRFRSSSDTEVVLRLYERYGTGFLPRLRGMFALAIHDTRDGPGRERLLLARDHFGIKPLLYASIPGGVVFASELKALLASGLVAPEIDPDGLRLLLTYGSVYQPSTMLRSVKMLPPAHSLTITAGGQRLERYWSLATPHASEFSRLSEAELTARVSRALRDSVRSQLVSDVPLGAFLSGGIDSSLLDAMRARETGHRVRTFSVGYESEGREFDETDDAQATAEFIGSEHTRIIVTGPEVRDALSHIAWSLDQPSIDGVNSYFVSKVARRSVTVAVSGNGGDELFAGYPWFLFMVQDRDRRRSRPLGGLVRAALARAARWSALDPLIGLMPNAGLARARTLEGFVARYSNLFLVFGPRDAARVVMPEVRARARFGRSLDSDIAPLDELRDGTDVQRVSGLCLRGYNANQLLRDIDAVSMAHSLEVRVPFLDPEVAAVALSLPDRLKLGDGKGLPEWGYSYRDSGAKRVLFEAGRGLLPEGMDLQPKRGFGMPFARWLQGPLREVLSDALGERSIRLRGVFRPERVRTELNAALAGAGSWTRPWALLIFELWCREVLDSNRLQSTDQVAPAAQAAGQSVGLGTS